MAEKQWIPARNDIVLLDFEPTTGKEMGKKRPALVLTSEGYNQTGLMMVCPISTSIRGAAIEVPLEGLDRPSVVVSSQVHTMDWRARKASKIGEADSGIFEQVIQRIIPLIGGELI